MFYRTAFKWLTITIIVLISFLAVLLFLGYLLKENEQSTIKLIDRLEQEAQQQLAEVKQDQLLYYAEKSLTTLEKSQQKIIAFNQTCQTDQQCFLVHTQSPALGCIVSVNTQGAAILLKVKTHNQAGLSPVNACQHEYKNQGKQIAHCRNNTCSF